MSKVIINISDQNLTLSAARNCLVDNINGYFQVVSFYLARNSSSDNNNNSTGFTVEFDERLKVLGADEDGWVFYSKIFNSQGRPVTARGRDTISQTPIGDNKFFVSTASARNYEDDGYLFFAMVQFPVDVKVGDTFEISIDTSADAEFICENSNDSAQDREADSAWCKSHVVNGGFTIIE